ncbi:MAG TPA: lecithin retinol acyltransferase family protein [Bryobacteraceae bacterium]|nr:lecithin retinol acyltransferase family protein [Bryobacteraceae bacterium]
MQMPTYQTGHPIQPGDWVRVFSSQFGVWHHGIARRLVFVPGGVAVEIIHNTKDGGVAVVDWYGFGDGNAILLHRRPQSPAHAAAVVARAEANIGNPYFLFAQNCEHFASFAFTGRAESETVNALGWVAAGVVAVAVLTSDAR